jgi:thymidylate synthase (FAD)
MKVELLEVFGNDLMAVNSARVSFGKKKEAFDLSDEKLIKYLVAHKHTSVFRHPQLQFRIICPIYVERQLFKHQVGMSANSISGRYVDFSDTYTKIDVWRKQSTDSKQGSEGVLNFANNVHAKEIQEHILKVCKEAYKDLIELGVSKEQARTILPLNLNTQFIWTGSLLSFIHLFKLRLKPDAQQETRELVQMMLDQVKENGSFKYSLEAFEL